MRVCAFVTGEFVSFALLFFDCDRVLLLYHFFDVPIGIHQHDSSSCSGFFRGMRGDGGVAARYGEPDERGPRRDCGVRVPEAPGHGAQNRFTLPL